MFNSWESASAVILATVVIAFTVVLFSLTSQIGLIRKEAVEKGYAEWTIDSKTGSTKWSWK
jgi:hypothetical protein